MAVFDRAKKNGLKADQPIIHKDPERVLRKRPKIMANNQEEANRDALNGLNDADRKETEEILGEIDAEAGKQGDEPDDAAKEEARRAALTEEERAAEDAAKAAKDGKVEEKKPEKPEERRKAPKLMPVYVHKVAEKKWSEEKATLLGQIEELSTTTSKGGEESPEAKAAREAKIKALAEKHGYDEEFVREVLELATENGGKLPASVEEGLRKAHMVSTERELETEEANYSADFDRSILPLIKAEYGDDVPPNVIADIKEDLKGLAYSEEYGKVPYSVIYKGQDQFRGLIPGKKKAAEGSRGGTGEGSVGDLEKPDLTQPLSDDVIKTLSDTDFETYSKNMEQREKQK